MQTDCIGWDQDKRFEIRTDRGSPLGAAIKGADSRGVPERVDTDRQGVE